MYLREEMGERERGRREEMRERGREEMSEREGRKEVRERERGEKR